MCQSCGCSPCKKCGMPIEKGVCSGCKKKAQNVFAEKKTEKAKNKRPTFKQNRPFSTVKLIIVRRQKRTGLRYYLCEPPNYVFW